MSKYGFVYFATNPSMPGLVKIGMTSYHPRLRINQLASNTSCPSAFELIAFFDYFNAQWAESEIHKELDEYRLNSSREFFNAPLRVIQHLMRQWGDPNEGCFVSSKLDALVDAEEKSYG